MSRENHYLFRFVNTSDDDIQVFLNTLHDRNKQVIVGYSDYPPTLDDISELNGVILEPTDNFTASNINDIFKDVVSDGELIYAEVVGGSVPDNSEFISISTNQSVNSEVVDKSTVGNQQVSNENNEHVSNKSDDVIDELLPSVETLRNTLTPELNVDYDLSKLSAQDRMNHMMFENNLSTMYNVNRDYIRDVKDDNSLDEVIEDLRKELSNSHLQGISDYQQSLDKLKNFEQKLNDEKSQIKQRYEDEMNRYIQDEVEKLKQQYRESHPDTTDEEIEALVKQSEPEIQRLKQAISFNRSNAKEDVFDKLLEINPDNQSLTKALDYLQEKKRIESQLSQMYELLEQERENIKSEQENVQSQKQEVKAEPEVSERERELEAQLRQQQQLNEQRERERESIDSNLIAQEVIKQIESSGILSQLGSSTAKAEEVIKDIPAPNDEELDNVTNQADKFIEQSGVKGYTSDDIEPEKSFEEVTEPESTDEQFNEMFGELGFDDDFDDNFDDEEQSEEPVEEPVEEEPVEEQSEQPAEEEEPVEEELVEPTEQENRNTKNIGAANVDELNDEFNSDDEDDIIDSFNEHVDDEQDLDLSYDDSDEMSDIAEEQAIQDSLVDDDYSYQDDNSDLDDLDDVDDEDDFSHLSKRERRKLEKEKRKQEKRAEKARKKREKRENKEVKRKPEKDTYGNTEENTPTFFKKMMLIGITLFVLLALAGTVFGVYKIALSPETADEPPTEETADTNNTEQAGNEESGETEVAEDGETGDESKEKVKPIPKKGEIYRLAVSDKDYTVTEVHDDGSAVLQAQGEEPITVPHEEFVKLKEKEEAEKEKEK